MSADIIDFELAKEEREPHIVSHAKCRECGHEAISVRHHEADPTTLECPKCGAMAMEATDD